MVDEPIVSPSEPRQPLLLWRRYAPIATGVILVANIIVFALMTSVGGSTNPDVLLSFGASYAPYFRRGEYWRVVMPMFLHIGWLHLLVNSVALYMLGRILEGVYGYGRFAVLYVSAGMGSSLLSMTMSPHVAAGASGAVFGMAGSMLVAGYLHRNSIPPRLRRVFGAGIVPLILVNLLFGLSVPGIDNWGHLGGLATGMVLTALIRPASYDLLPEYTGMAPSQAIVVVPIIVVSLAVGSMVDHYRLTRVVNRLLQEGARLHDLGQSEQAIARFQEAARRAPRDERPHERLGLVFLHSKRIAEAMREYQEALRLNPHSQRAQLGLGLTYRLSGDFAKARQLMESVLGKDPRTAEGHVELALLYDQQKLYEEAVRHYEQALRLNPDLAVAHNNLAWLYATSQEPRFRNPEAALQHAQRAVELDRWKEAAFIDTLAEALYANQRYEEAVRTQSKALELEPQNSEYQEHMARYRKAAGM